MSQWNLPFGMFPLECFLWNVSFGMFPLEWSVENYRMGIFPLDMSPCKFPMKIVHLELSHWNFVFGILPLDFPLPIRFCSLECVVYPLEVFWDFPSGLLFGSFPLTLFRLNFLHWTSPIVIFAISHWNSYWCLFLLEFSIGSLPLELSLCNSRIGFLRLFLKISLCNYLILFRCSHLDYPFGISLRNSLVFSLWISPFYFTLG